MVWQSRRRSLAWVAVTLLLPPARIDNELVAAIYTFVGPHLEAVRRQLVEAQREQRASEESKRLRREANKIEEIINDDFATFRKRLQKVRAAAAKTGFDAASGEADAGEPGGDDDFLYGGDEPATIVEETGDPGQREGNGDSSGGEPRRLNPIVTPDPEGKSGGHSETAGGAKPRRHGGFQIEFDHQGEGTNRALDQREKRTIFINLDHPQIATALKGRGVEDPVFRRLAYEVAFSEYAIALAVELDNRQEFLDPQDAITEIGLTVHRIAREAAALYA